MNTPIERLKERITHNYDEFRESILELDKETIFDLAMHITAVTDTFIYLTTEDWLTEYDILYLLNFTNPLKLVADAWEDALIDDFDFREVLGEVLEDDENEENYMTVARERELRDKYGEDTNITYALISEIIEAGKHFLSLHNPYDELGADVCKE